MRNKLGLSSAKLRNSQFSALTLLESKKGLVVLLAALSMTISNIFFEGGGREVWQVRIYIFAESYSCCMSMVYMNKGSRNEGRAEEVRVGIEGVRAWMFKITPPTFMHSVGRGINGVLKFC